MLASELQRVLEVLLRDCGCVGEDGGDEEAIVIRPVGSVGRKLQIARRRRCSDSSIVQTDASHSVICGWQATLVTGFGCQRSMGGTNLG